MNYLEFTDCVVYCPEVVPWPGRCRLVRLDIESGIIALRDESGSLTTMSASNDIDFCPYTGAKDISGNKVYLGDILDDSGIKYTVVRSGRGFALNRVPDGNGINLPVTYAKYLRLSGSLNDAFVFTWMDNLVSELERERNLCKQEERDMLRSRNPNSLKEWKDMCVKRLRGYIENAHCLVFAHLDLMYKKTGTVHDKNEYLHRVNEHAVWLLGQIGFSTIVRGSVEKEQASWECSVNMAGSVEIMSGLHTWGETKKEENGKK